MGVLCAFLVFVPSGGVFKRNACGNDEFTKINQTILFEGDI